MGKKDKRKGRGSSKRRKLEPPSPPRPKLLRYEDMPLDHKRKFYLNDDCGTAKKYIEILCWLRFMGCSNGTVFDGIPNLNWAGEDFPLVEVEVVSRSGARSTKFIFVKMTMYLLAFVAHDSGVQYSDKGIIIEGFRVLEEYDGKYISSPWERVGPRYMMEASEILTQVGDVDDRTLVLACETFIVHLIEAARIYPIESIIYTSLLTQPLGLLDNPTYTDEENFILVAQNGQTVEDDNDVLRFVKKFGPVDFNHFVRTPKVIQNLIKNYGLMSKVWYLYSLTGVFEMKPDKVTNLGLRSLKSLRCTLAMLCNTNLEKVLSEWKIKSAQHQHLTPQIFQDMMTRVRALQEQKKVFVSTVE